MFYNKLGKNFFYYRSGQLLSLLGLRCSTIALSWYIISVSHSGFYLSLFLFSTSIATLLLTPLMGPIADIYSRKKCTIIADIWSGLVMLVIFVLLAYSHITLSLLIVLNLIFCIGNSLALATSTSLMSKLVDSSQISNAFQFIGILRSVGIVFGAILGGALTHYISVPSAVLINSLMLFLSAFLTSNIKLRSNKNDNFTHDTILSAIANWPKQFVLGMNAIVKIPTELCWSIVAGAINFCMMPFVFLLLPLYIKTILHKGANYYGFCGAAVAVGIFLGSTLVTRLLNHIIYPDIIVVLGLFLMGLSVFSFSIFTHFWFSLVILSILGCGLMLHNVNALAKRILAIPNSYRSRVNSASRTLSTAFEPIGFLVIGSAVDFVNIQILLYVIALIMCLSAFTLTFIPNFKQLMRYNSANDDCFYAKQYEKAFQ